MATLTAVGKIGDVLTTIVCTEKGGKIHVTFNGHTDAHKREVLDTFFKIAEPVAYNFYYDENSLAGYYHIFKTTYYFTKLISIESDIDLETPLCKDGLLY